jgi:hypothetical protein
MKDGLSTVLTVLSICSIVGAFLMWILGRVLTDKKDKMLLAFRIETLEQKISDLKVDASKIDQVSTELEIIKERIKHL